MYAIRSYYEEASLFLSFVMQISPYCDCYGNNDRPIAPDVGIFASGDPVALDQACADAVIRSAGRDPFRETHPEIVITSYSIHYTKLYELIEESFSMKVSVCGM